MISKDIKNRYDDVYTFVIDEDNNVLWTGPFVYYRLGYLNDISLCYAEYCKDNGEIDFNEFEKIIYEYVDATDNKHGYYKYEKYFDFIKTTNKIEFVDPSGGMFIQVNDSLGFVDDSLKDKKIKEIVKVINGYKLITY